MNRKIISVVLALGLLVELTGCRDNSNSTNKDVLTVDENVANSNDEEYSDTEYKLKNMSGVSELKEIDANLLDNRDVGISSCSEEISGSPSVVESGIYGMSRLKQSGKDVQYYVVSGEENINEILDSIESELKDDSEGEVAENTRGAQKYYLNVLLPLEQRLQSTLSSLNKQIDDLKKSISSEKNKVPKEINALMDRYYERYQYRLGLNEKLEADVENYRKEIISKLLSLLDSENGSRENGAENLYDKKSFLLLMGDLDYPSADENLQDTDEDSEDNTRAHKWVKRGITRVNASIKRLETQIKQCKNKIENLKWELNNVKKQSNQVKAYWNQEIGNIDLDIAEFNKNYAAALADRKKIVISEITTKIKEMNLKASDSVSLLSKSYEYLNGDSSENRGEELKFYAKRIEINWGEDREADTLDLIIPENSDKDIAIVAVCKDEDSGNGSEIQVIPVVYSE